MVMHIAALLFCLVLISASATSGLYAKYVSKGSGEDGARMIKFNELRVTETGDFVTSAVGQNMFMFAPGIPLEKDVEVEFGGSEAATIIFVLLETEGFSTTNGVDFVDSQNLLSWSAAVASDNPAQNKGIWTYLAEVSGGNKHVYYKLLDPNQPLSASDFIYNGTINVSENGDINIYNSFPTTKLNITVFAVQANGFDSTKDAWNSINSKR
jgi:hypothetical protein